MSRAQRKEPVRRAFVGLAGSFLAVVKTEAPAPQPPAPPPELLKAKRGRPPKHDKTMSPAERKRQSRAKKENDLAVNKLIAEQKIDKATGGRGAGMLMTDADESGVAKIVTGRVMDNLENVLATYDQQNDYGELEFRIATYSEGTFGGRKAAGGPNTGDRDGTTPAIDNTGDKDEHADTFSRRHPIRKTWKYDERDKEEIARKNARDFIEPCERWDETLEDGGGLTDAFRCKVCRRVFGFHSSAVNHIGDSIGDEKFTASKPHRRAVLKGISSYQPGAKRLIS